MGDIAVLMLRFVGTLALLASLASAITLPHPDGGTNHRCDWIPTRIVPTVGYGTLDRTMAEIHNTRFTYLASAADYLNCDIDGMAGVLKAESGNTGFDENGRMIIRFENHVFRDYYTPGMFLSISHLKTPHRATFTPRKQLD